MDKGITLSDQMQTITDIEIYNSRMAKSSIDKIFFLSMIENDLEYILDYGCADGSLTCFMAELCPDIQFYGYDNSLEMIELASQKETTGIQFCSNLSTIMEQLDSENTLLNLSSIIHEVYSYCSEKEIKEFWSFVFTSNFRYIAIRDMMVNRSVDYKANLNDLNKFEANFSKEKIQDFEKQYGSIQENKNFLHLLLKYKYLENWNREVRENYFPIYLEELVSLIPTDQYEIIYLEHYPLPYTKQQIKTDFGIDLKDNTHVKLLLVRK